MLSKGKHCFLRCTDPWLSRFEADYDWSTTRETLLPSLTFVFLRSGFDMCHPASPRLWVTLIAINVMCDLAWTGMHIRPHAQGCPPRMKKNYGFILNRRSPWAPRCLVLSGPRSCSCADFQFGVRARAAQLRFTEKQLHKCVLCFAAFCVFACTYIKFCNCNFLVIWPRVVSQARPTFEVGLACETRPRAGLAGLHEIVDLGWTFRRALAHI